MSETITVQSVVDGQVFKLRKSLFDNEYFNAGNLVEVPEGTKPFIPETYKEKTVEEFEKTHPGRVKNTSKDDESEGKDS